MIYTLTLNPSLDYIVTVKDFQMGKTNRTLTEKMVPGGKGINVSMVLDSLGIESRLLGFTAGFTGQELKQKIRAMGLKEEFLELSEGFTRINVKMKDFEGTEINGQGPVVEAAAEERLLAQLDQLTKGDILVLAGSVLKGMFPLIYSRILERLSEKGVLFVVDASGQSLWEVLKYKPFLIKPNHQELGDLFGVQVDSREGAIPYAKKLQEKGARNVFVSLAGEGAVLLSEDGTVYQRPAPRGRLVNGVGAGDSMVAGFLAGWLEKKKDPAAKRTEYAFCMGVAAGSASAFSENLATGEMIRNLMERM